MYKIFEYIHNWLKKIYPEDIQDNEELSKWMTIIIFFEISIVFYYFSICVNTGVS